MSTIRQVEDALGALVQSAVYPAGLNQPSVTTRGIRIVTGWPIKNQLDLDMSANISQVSIYPVKAERNTTRFDRRHYEISRTSPVILATVVNSNITITGTIVALNNVMIIVNGVGYAYTVQVGDTLNSIAQSMAALIPNASATTNIITVGGLHGTIVARTGGYGNTTYISKTQKKVYWITVWSDNFTDRETISDAIDVKLGDLIRFSLPDGFYSSILYKGSNELDALEKSLIYRRDLIYEIEYNTTINSSAYEILDPFYT